MSSGSRKNPSKPPARRGRPPKAPAKRAGGEGGHAPNSSPLPSLPSDDDFTPSVESKRRKKSPPPPRSPLPDREKRNKDPAATGIPPEERRIPPEPRRSHEEVLADKAELEALKAQIAQLHKERVEAIAAMEVDDDARAEAAAASTVRHKPLVLGPKPVLGRREQPQDLDPSDSDTPCLDFSDADFDAVAEADERIRLVLKADRAERAREAQQYDLSKLPPLPALPVTKVPKGRRKGEGRAAVDEAKERMSHKRALGDELDTVIPKKKTKPSFPSGLASDWKSKITVTGTAHSSSSKAPKDRIPLGGLADFDADALRPGSSKSKGARVANDTIEILSDTEDEDDDTPVRSKQVLKGKQTVVIKQERKPPVKTEPKNESFADAATAEIIGLPLFARDGWVPLFLPTWNHYIGTRTEGWEICKMGDEVKAVQEVTDIVWPGSGWRVRKGDAIYNTAMARLGDKRHVIGQATMKVVDGLFASPDYHDKPGKIKKYAKWAIDEHGPGWYESPAPRHQSFPANTPGWIGPTGLFRSKYVMGPLTAFVKSTSKSRGNFGNHFIGAAAMIGAGLERAFNQYITGTKVLNGTFSFERVGDYAAGFAKSAREMEDWRWKKIMGCIAENLRLQAGPLVSASTSMNLNRGALFLGSSPAKGDDDDDEDME
ncbi:hypothetical protein C8R43DRAFT_1122893 [Mycena crocata]|nr:hypothetical protein C8R43DRAFT_1122893 [Mycena crocata]